MQDLCWHCFHIGILKRNFKLWLQTSPYDTPGFPYGRFSPVDYDLTRQEVLNIHQIPQDIRQIHLRAHHPEGLLDWIWHHYSLTTFAIRCPCSSTTFLLNIFFSRIVASSSTGSIVTYFDMELKSCLEHPALLAGCVCVPSAGCVCTFSKEVKPVLGLREEHMIVFGKNLHHEEFGLLVFLFQAVGLHLQRNIFFHDFGAWCLSFC